MKRGLILLLAVCTFAAAMVPRDRRAVNTEEDEEMLKAQSTTSKPTEKLIEICAPQTPCEWSLYNPETKYVEMTIKNSYCECGVGTVCILNENDSTVSSFVYRCREPSTEPEETTVDS